VRVVEKCRLYRVSVSGEHSVVYVSLTGALYCERFVFSVALGDDIVPRLSISSAFDLKIRLLTKLLSCDMPKVYCSHLVYFLCFCLIFKKLFFFTQLKELIVIYLTEMND